MADQSADQNEHDDMLVARAKALEEYALLESSLARLFTSLLGTSDQKGSIVFFAMGAGSRARILRSLLEALHKKQYDVHWYGEAGSPGTPRTGGLFTLIHQLDSERNKIVHWHPVQKVELLGDGNNKSSLELMPPHFWNRAPKATPIAAQMLIDFKKKANFVYRSISMFYVNTDAQFRGRFGEDVRTIWLDILARPVLYPPPATHPIQPQ